MFVIIVDLVIVIEFTGLGFYVLYEMPFINGQARTPIQFIGHSNKYIRVPAHNLFKLVGLNDPVFFFAGVVAVVDIVVSCEGERMPPNQESNPDRLNTPFVGGRTTVMLFGGLRPAKPLAPVYLEPS